MFGLLKKDVVYRWDSFCDEAFNLLKDAITSTPILQYLNFEDDFILTTDANDNEKKKLKIYTTTEKELLAIVWSVTHFRPYLFSRKFLIRTDHKPLVWLFNIKDPSSRLIRWRIKLEEYNFNIHIDQVSLTK